MAAGIWISVPERFALNLRRLRKRAGLTQAELASRCELHRSEVGELEGGERVPRIDTALKLAGALGLAFDFALFDGIEWRTLDKGGGLFYAMAPMPGTNLGDPGVTRPANRWWEEILSDLEDPSLDGAPHSAISREVRERGLALFRAIASHPNGESRAGLLRALSDEDPEREGHLGRMVGHMASEGLLSLYGSQVRLGRAGERFDRVMQAAHALRYRRR